MDIAEDKYDGLGADTLVEIQAEISFKAGIREVVEFSNDICVLHRDADARVRQGKILRKGNCYECWQAQVKKWGVKP